MVTKRSHIEYENGNKSLSFPDINITNTINNEYEFKVYRKKSHYQHTHQTKIMYWPQHRQKFIERFPSQSTVDMFLQIYWRKKFLIVMFTENGHNK